MKYNKLPGGEANNMSDKDFTTSEKKAISKGAKIESKEHGKTAPREIAADHVKESGDKYYDDKVGLPAMEKRLEKTNTSMKPAMQSSGMKAAYDPNMSADEHKAAMKAHNEAAAKAAKEGNRQSAAWHYQQSHKHYKALVGNPPSLPEHKIDDMQKGDVIKFPDKPPNNSVIELINGKVYIGKVTAVPSEEDPEKIFTVVPFLSGYKEHEKQTTIYNVRYPSNTKEIDDEIDPRYTEKNEENTSIVSVLIPYNQIRTIRLFDLNFFIECYKKELIELPFIDRKKES